MYKHIGLVDLMGGLGNQIFQLNFANYLKRRGFKVYVNLSWFNSDIFNDGTTKRNLQLNPSDFELNEVNESTEKKFLRIENLLNTKLINKLAARILKESYYLHSGHLFNEENIKKYNRFSGYWQNEKYLVGQKTFLLNSLNKTSHFNENLNKPNKKTLIHIRKTDYLKLDEELSEAFYINAIKEILGHANLSATQIYTHNSIKKLKNVHKQAHPKA